jgi:upstream-binding transcription factor
MTAFMYFSGHMRPGIRMKQPELKMPEVASALGKMWTALPETEKLPFRKLEEEDRARYQREMAAYVPPPSSSSSSSEEESSSSEEEKRRRKPKGRPGRRAKDVRPDRRGRKRVTDPAHPKHPIPAFLFYTSERRPKVVESNEGMDVRTIARTLGEQWRALSPEERKPYEEKAVAERERYQREMADYTPPREGKKKKAPRGKKKAPRGRKKRRRPTKAPSSAEESSSSSGEDSSSD